MVPEASDFPRHTRVEHGNRPFWGLLVFEAFLEFMLGEEEASGFDDDELEDDWEAFIRFRRWELGYGSTSL